MNVTQINIGVGGVTSSFLPLALINQALSNPDSCQIRTPVTDNYESSMRWQELQWRIDKDRPRAKRLDPFPNPTAVPTPSPSTVFAPSDRFLIFRARLRRLIVTVRNSLSSFSTSSSFSLLILLLLLSGWCPNPGPGLFSCRTHPRTPPSSVQSHPCGICSVEVRKGTYWLLCQVGNHWIHKVCSVWRWWNIGGTIAAIVPGPVTTI